MRQTHKEHLVDELGVRIARLERLVDYWQRTGAAPTPDAKADGAIVEGRGRPPRVRVAAATVGLTVKAIRSATVYPRCPSCQQRHPVLVGELLDTAQAKHVGLWP